MLYIYDYVLELIKKDIGDFPPERGGALLGEPGKPIVTTFIFDPTAVTTSSSYVPSKLLNHMVQRAEKEDGLEFKGILHSHPGNYDQPSSQDLQELSKGLELNKHMPYYLVPIVTQHTFGQAQEHEVVMKNMKVSFFAGFRFDSQPAKIGYFESEPVHLKTMNINIIPLGQFTRDLEWLENSIIGIKTSKVIMVEQDQRPFMASHIEVDGLFDLLLLSDTSYPDTVPSILVTYSNGHQEELRYERKDDISFILQLETIILDLINAVSIEPIHPVEHAFLNGEPIDTTTNEWMEQVGNNSKILENTANLPPRMITHKKSRKVSFSISRALFTTKEKTSEK